MRNALITFIHGDDYVRLPDLEVTLKSLQKLTGFKKIVLTSGVKEANSAYLAQYFDEVTPVKNPDITHCVSDRFLSYYLWICDNHDKYDNLFHIDCRDVYFQKNPFEWMAQFPEKNIFITTEGFVQSYSSWNRNEQTTLQSTMRVSYDFMNNWVLNSGTIGGKTAVLSQLFLNIWSNTNRKDIRITDQAIVNYFYPQFVSDPTVMITDATKDDFCLIGESVNWADVECHWENEMAHDLKGNPYYIFHQWDRTYLKDTIMQLMSGK
jgi:hypothetical protein